MTGRPRFHPCLHDMWLYLNISAALPMLERGVED